MRVFYVEVIFMVKVNLKCLVEKIVNEHVPVEEVNVKNNQIILKGDLGDFNLFLDELFLELPEDYTFDVVNVCEVTVRKREIKII